MAYITPIEMKHTIMKTNQHSHNGHLLYISGPIHKRQLPTAVAPSHNPWQRPCKCLGATIDTKHRTSGQMTTSATLRKKQVRMSPRGAAFHPARTAGAIEVNTSAEGQPFTMERIMRKP